MGGLGFDWISQILVSGKLIAWSILFFMSLDGIEFNHKNIWLRLQFVLFLINNIVKGQW